MIEAVFEDPEVKARVFAEIEPHLAPDALLGSNTSTLPITGLAEGVSRPGDFIGLHFFSPVDKMPLLEAIKGEKTSETTLYRALDLAKQIKKTPIVVHDSRGFFTSRVIGTFIEEGIAMLLEGVPAATIEQACSQAGYPTPVLQLSDEVNLELMRKIRDASKAAAEAWAAQWVAHPMEQVIDRMLDEFERHGRHAGAGFTTIPTASESGCGRVYATRSPRCRTPAPSPCGTLRSDFCSSSRSRPRMLRRGRDRVGRRRQHRLDTGDRLPGLDRRRAAVHQRLRAPRPRHRHGGVRNQGARARCPVRRPVWAARVAGRERRARRAVPGPSRGRDHRLARGVTAPATRAARKRRPPARLNSSFAGRPRPHLGMDRSLTVVHAPTSVDQPSQKSLQVTRPLRALHQHEQSGNAQQITPLFPLGRASLQAGGHGFESRWLHSSRRVPAGRPIPRACSSLGQPKRPGWSSSLVIKSRAWHFDAEPVRGSPSNPRVAIDKTIQRCPTPKDPVGYGYGLPSRKSLGRAQYRRLANYPQKNACWRRC